MIESAKYAMPSLTVQVIARWKKKGKISAEDLIEISELEQIVETVWMYWSRTGDWYSKHTLDHYHSKLLKEIVRIETKVQKP